MSILDIYKKKKKEDFEQTCFFIIYFLSRHTQTKLAFDKQKTDHVELENNISAA